MAEKLHLVSKERHADRGWKRFTDYRFAANRGVMPLAMGEVPRAAVEFPLAFLKAEEGPVLAAVLGMASDRSAFVGDSGRWLGDYVPAGLRGYPFKVTRTRNGDFALCVDEASGLVVARNAGEAFLEFDGQPTRNVSEILEFLVQSLQGVDALTTICKLLAEHDLLEPWPVTLRDSRGEHRLEGLQRINEPALHALDADHFLQLRKQGALPVAYLQLVSMQNISKLTRMGDAKRKSATTPERPPLNLGLMLDDGDSGIIDFSRLNIGTRQE